MSAGIPKGIGETASIEAHGRILRVKYHSRGTYFLRIVGEQRARWGNAREAREDIAYFLETNALPPASAASF